MMGFDVQIYGNPVAEILLVQMVDGHDLALIDREVKYIWELTGGMDFCLKAVKVNHWNKDLAPWRAPAVFGKEDFGDGAADTLAILLRDVIPCEDAAAKRIFIGGYSLAGLFALWAGYQTERFAGIAAASPSVWFPSFTRYMAENRIRTEAVYLSLGDREARTRNPVMAQVGDAIQVCARLLQEGGTDCTFEWNRGNHFNEPDLRTAKAFAWLMKRKTNRISSNMSGRRLRL